MTSVEMKDILYKKLQDEGCYFKKKDISVKRSGRDVVFEIAGYEHCPFTLMVEEDEFFAMGYIVMATIPEEGTVADEIVKNKENLDRAIRDVIVRIGYYIGTRF